MNRCLVLPLLASLFIQTAFGASPADPFAQAVADDAQLRSALSRPAAKLLKAQVLRGQFTHSRSLSEIPRPLIATGDFLFVRDLGVYWHTRQPFDSIVILTEAGIVQADEGAAPQRIAAGEQPVRFIAKIFMALFTLDVASLRRDFDLYGGQPDDRWIIGLKPRTRAIAGVFSQATVSGTADVEQVVLTDARGDRTIIDLRNVSYSSDPPDADVRALFAIAPQ
jgi:Outer membrane lipoprotein carrier protein LolA